MAFENGVDWQPREPDRRGRHATFDAAVEAAFKDLLTERNPFFDTLADRWPALFPGLPARSVFFMWPSPFKSDAGFAPHQILSAISRAILLLVPRSSMVSYAPAAASML